VIEALEHHFKHQLDLPPAAVDWLLDLWQVIQVFDDAHDGAPVGDVMPALWASLVSMPSNPFYVANAAALQGAVATAILKWHAANEAEDAGEADERSFVWRAAYYDVVLLVVLLCYGQTEALRLAPVVMLMYGEPFAAYREEFPNA
jgi:hypothetical protein